jgi:SAM-dependent methyltransferase
MKNYGPDWHRQAVGGLWDEVGKLQFDLLIAHGLKPEHYLLDVGCGSLRAGVHFIKYLETSHYVGIDRSPEMLDAARNIELGRYNLVDKKPLLMQMENFEFYKLSQKFPFALAQSVFTHLPLNHIILCLMNVQDALLSGGRFFVTFFENRKGKHYREPIVHDVKDGQGLISYFERDPFHYDFDTFKWICEGTELEVEYIGDWNHPRDQKLLIFTKR